MLEGLNEVRQHDVQKCYIWLNDETVTEPLAIVYGCYFPVINEKIILWDETELFQNYKVVRRIFGINKENQSIVLNIYVEKIEDIND